MTLSVLGVMLVLLVLPSTGQAQVDVGDIGAQIGKAMSDAMTKMRNRKILVNPALITVDVTRKTATIEFSNPTEDTLEAEISADVRAPRALAAGFGFRKDGTKGGAGLLANSETAAPVDSTRPDSSLVRWIRNLPARLKLAPGEKKSVTVTVDIPADTKPGEYVAWIVTATPSASTQKPQPTTSGDGGTVFTVTKSSNRDGSPAMVRVGAKMVVRIEAKP